MWQGVPRAPAARAPVEERYLARSLVVDTQAGAWPSQLTRSVSDTLLSAAVAGRAALPVPAAASASLCQSCGFPCVRASAFPVSELGPREPGPILFGLCLRRESARQQRLRLFHFWRLVLSI